MTDNAPGLSRINESEMSGFIESTRRMGMTPQQSADFLRNLGPERADIVTMHLGRIVGGNPQITGPQILDELSRTSGFNATQYSPAAAEYIRRMMQPN